ncbi:DEAD/DEAH box helicase [Gammaproteobacteria bacterium]|nr:DEAD/DEAH box helicase [Gammaproteobacteria bacterium]
MALTSIEIKKKQNQVEFVLSETNQTFHFFYLKVLGNTVDNRYLIEISVFVHQFHLIDLFFIKHQGKIEGSLNGDLLDFIKGIPNCENYIDSTPISESDLENKLRKENFIRKLKSFQKRNVTKLCALPAAADFSVPGAGKTTDALAFYCFNKKPESKLLVISPINAFLSWEDDIKDCLGPEKELVRLRGETQELNDKLSSNNEFFIINYESLQNDSKIELLKDFLSLNPDSILILDESHRAKSEKRSQLLQKISIFPRRKLIMTGTPMPQSVEDLNSQFTFLYPMHNILEDEKFLESFQPFYVRTNDSDLGLKDIVIRSVQVKPKKGHQEFYDKYIDHNLNNSADLLNLMEVKDIKKAYMKLLKFFSNPILELELIERIDNGLARIIEQEEDGAKIDAVVDRAIELIKQGEKVLIWSSFVANVERIAQRLSHYGSEYIHGGIKTDKDSQTENEDWEWEDLETREAKIKRFKEDDTINVLVANPAAAAESMSLHHVCNYALYCDRTYNAGQYLQSQKRIHRLTEGEDSVKTIEIFSLEVRASIDYHVDKRLAEKCHAMYKFLNESELTLDWLNNSYDDYYTNFSIDDDDYFQTKDELANYKFNE